jgi:hypothetical protein
MRPELSGDGSLASSRLKKSCRPTPGGRLVCFLSLFDRRGCTLPLGGRVGVVSLNEGR